ncbi:MAG TPA: DUF2125 domain-containing protein [Stellaceae bacterium]|jgi:hypothetical protein
MRRATVLGLAALVLLAVLLGGYSAYWLVAAARIKDGVAAWAQAARTRKIEVSWRDLRVGGFPLAFRISLDDAALRDAALSPAPQLHIASLSGTARPWDFSVWRLAAPGGLSAALAGRGARPELQFTAQTAEGFVALAPPAGARLWLTLQRPRADAGARLEAATADAWIVLPPKPPQGHIDPSFGLALDLHQLHLPAAIGAFGDGIDELAFGVTIKGALPGGDIVPAVSAWRDSGGTIELDNLHLEWDGIGAAATGTIALDQDLQPIGGFSGAIEGYDRVLTALVRAGTLHARDAGLARLALAMLAKIGPDGRPQITTSFTIQNGEMFLGPAKLGRAPRIAWQ